MTNLNIRPPAASIKNLVTGEVYEFQYNPQTFDENLEAKYNRPSIRGLSHERMTYKNTGNVTYPLELVLSQMTEDERSAGIDAGQTIQVQKAWLKSLLYPAAHEDLAFVGPPKVLFIWPGEIRTVGKFTKFRVTHREFSNRTLKCIRMTVRMTFEENLAVRRLMEDVIVTGSMVVEET